MYKYFDKCHMEEFHSVWEKKNPFKCKYTSTGSNAPSSNKIWFLLLIINKSSRYFELILVCIPERLTLFIVLNQWKLEMWPIDLQSKAI